MPINTVDVESHRKRWKALYSKIFKYRDNNFTTTLRYPSRIAQMNPLVMSVTRVANSLIRGSHKVNDDVKVVIATCDEVLDLAITQMALGINAKKVLINAEFQLGTATYTF